MNETLKAIIAALVASGVLVPLLNWILNRKTESKRVNYEGLDRQTDAFVQQRRAYDSIIENLRGQVTDSDAARDRADKARDRAMAELEEARRDREELRRQIGELKDKVESLNRADQIREHRFARLVLVFQDYVRRVAIPLSQSEWEIVDDTIPPDMLSLKRPRF